MSSYVVLRRNALQQKPTPVAWVTGVTYRGAGPAAAGNLSVDVVDERPRPGSLSGEDDVAPVMQVRLVKPVSLATPAVAGEIDAWGVEAIKASSSGYDGAGVTVAILDTGINRAHPAFAHLKDRIVTKNFIGTDDAHADDNGHGTHCAGVVFGQLDGHRIGIAPGVKRALVGKVLDKNGLGTTEQIVRGIVWAAQEGADIISISIGLDFPGMVKQLLAKGYEAEFATARALSAYRENVRMFDSLAATLETGAFLSTGALVVAAAGNESKRDKGTKFDIGVAPPAVAKGFVSVGALGKHGTKLAVAGFSNSGPALVAPGVDIWSADLGTGLRKDSGTSMATPHVAGAAVLWAQHLRETSTMNSERLREKVFASCIKAGLDEGGEAYYGRGIVQCPVRTP